MILLFTVSVRFEALVESYKKRFVLLDMLIMGLSLHVSPILDRFPSLEVDVEAEILRYKVCVIV